jgi:hypothetical protein
VVSTRYEGHGVQHRPNTTENGHMERGNPPSALSDEAGAGDQAASLGGVGCRANCVRAEANASL